MIIIIIIVHFSNILLADWVVQLVWAGDGFPVETPIAFPVENLLDIWKCIWFFKTFITR